MAYFGEDELGRIGHLPWELGQVAEETPTVRQYLCAALNRGKDATGKAFNLTLAASWVAASREADPQRAAQTLRSLVSAAADSETKTALLERCYWRFRAENGPVTADELRLIVSMREEFIRVHKSAAFINCTAWSLVYGWMEDHAAIDLTIRELDEDERVTAVGELVETVAWAAHKSNAPTHLGKWIAGLIVELPNPGRLGEGTYHHLDRIFDNEERLDIDWFVTACQTRLQLAADATDRPISAFSYHRRFSRFVEPLSEATKEESRGPLKNLVAAIADQEARTYLLPLYLHDIDPDGVLVPELAAHAIGRVASTDWRKIARWHCPEKMDTLVTLLPQQSGSRSSASRTRVG